MAASSNGRGRPCRTGEKRSVRCRVGFASRARRGRFDAVPRDIPTSFLLPAYNEEKFIGRAIGSIRAAVAHCRLDRCEIIVCDNASTDRTAELASAAGAIVVPEPHRQIARARNTAARAASGRQLVWLDADAMLTPAVLGATLATFASGGFCGGGALVELEGEEMGWSARRTVDTWNAIARVFRLAAGSYFFALREGWEATGGFNEAVYAGEELGFSNSLKKWGRARGLRFRILPHPVPSSARKVRQFTARQVLRQCFICAWPGNLARRDRCALWYERVEEVEG